LLSDGATNESSPDDWLEELEELEEDAVAGLLEPAPDELVDPEEPCVAARPVNAAVPMAARIPIARVIRFTRRRFRSRSTTASVLMVTQWTRGD
jgi:hypothetical protein